ncbi:MAG: FtsX-like permease family protein, partial [Spirochaetes bacterium]|nr:FtsX-like permease family protein [Spirochaetota bacterium]
VIIMMNTIVISVTERIPEIGTMRAIGAQKGFVRRMIIAETLMVSVIFGIIGIILGALVLGVLYLKGIPASNIFLQILFGGKVLHPVMSVQSLVLALVVTAVIGIIASLYPVSVALKIQPVKAMQRT